MKLQEINDLGGFIKADELISKEIKFKMTEDGEEVTATIFVRRLSIGNHEAIWANEKKDVSRTAKLLAEAIRLGDEGEERMTYEQAYNLNARIATAMMNAVAEVNGGERKNSVPSSVSDTE